MMNARKRRVALQTIEGMKLGVWYSARDLAKQSQELTSVELGKLFRRLKQKMRLKKRTIRVDGFIIGQWMRVSLFPTISLSQASKYVGDEEPYSFFNWRISRFAVKSLMENNSMEQAYEMLDAEAEATH